MTPKEVAALLRERAFDLSMASDQHDHADTIKKYEDAAKQVDRMAESLTVVLDQYSCFVAPGDKVADFIKDYAQKVLAGKSMITDEDD